MRRVLAVLGVLLSTTLVASACSGSAGDKGSAAVARANGKGDTSPGSTFAVCAQIRAALTADMKALGPAFGAIVGRTTAGDTSGRSTAVDQTATVLKKIGTDISAAAATAKDPNLRTAGTAAATQVNALANDSGFMSSIGTMDDIPDATDRLTKATSQLTTMCQVS